MSNSIKCKGGLRQRLPSPVRVHEVPTKRSICQGVQHVQHRGWGEA